MYIESVTAVNRYLHAIYCKAEIAKTTVFIPNANEHIQKGTHELAQWEVRHRPSH